MEVCKSNMIGDESKNMDNSVDERYRERSEIKVMNDHYCKSNTWLRNSISNFTKSHKIM